ncbi:hypothetical protein Lalb_Chr04g0264561 [Lupinus albus]|uniref:Uncharacterized protein n=1 Tax=Lupinus albus TaxID=3870 RepID=A0A6A4QQM2_LUPAL|nr:hypothetical protein Lalb_Chr04g0264561 [Lupinus albus]
MRWRQTHSWNIEHLPNIFACHYPCFDEMGFQSIYNHSCFIVQVSNIISQQHNWSSYLQFDFLVW